MWARRVSVDPWVRSGWLGSRDLAHPPLLEANCEMAHWCDIVWRVPETTVKLDGPQGHTRLRRAILLVVTTDYTERMQAGIIRGKYRWGQVQEKPGASFQVSHPKRVQPDALNSPSSDG